MSKNKYDGITINTIDDYNKKLIITKEPYNFFMYRLTRGDNIKLDQLASFSIYVLIANSDKPLIIKENSIILNQGDTVQIENSEVTLEIFSSVVELLVAGITESYTKDKKIEIVREKDIYRVTKPWGYEFWINGRHPGYMLKRVEINSGKRTSLQYHKYKQETSIIFSGRANIYYKNQDKSNDEISFDDIRSIKVLPITSIDIYPNTIHRIEALTDSVSYEVSTPYPDDVIRIQDDAARNNGYIPSEHGVIS